MPEQLPMPDPQNTRLPIPASAPRVKDPVCGMMVDPQKSAGKVLHADETYYFCSKRCAERFEKEPEKFLEAPGASGMEPASHARTSHQLAHASPSSEAISPAKKDARYTCPMHPEIVQIGPGSCPICGMALEPMDAFAEVEADPEYDSMLRRFWVSAALSLPVLLIAMFGDALELPLSSSARNWIEFVLADAGRALGRLAIFPSLLGLHSKSQPQYVHADWLGHRRCVSGKCRGDAPSANFPHFVSRHARRRLHLL